MSETSPDPARLAAEARRAAGKNGKKLPPVHLWNPPFCGDMDLVIRRDGSWHYLNSPIGRKAMVDLFSTILRHDDDGCFYLVTPVEKCRIQVEDAPFVAITLRVEGEGREQVLTLSTNVGDEVLMDSEHALRVQIDAETGEPRPYIRVRANLDALVHRNVFYRLVEIAVPETHAGERWLGVWSCGEFFPIDREPN